jgi:hypothetical protein
MRTLILISFFVAFVQVSKAQDLSQRNSIYGELGGNGGFISLSYERILFSKLPALNIRAGLGFLALKEILYLTAPVGLFYGFELKNPNKTIEIGVSYTYGWVDSRFFRENQGSSFMTLQPNLAYKHSFKSNLFWRLSLMPVFDLRGDGYVTSWAGFGIGKKF